MSTSLEDGDMGAGDAAGGGGGGSSVYPTAGTGDGGHSGNAFLTRLFSVFESDPKGAVHRVWGITLLFMVAFFVVSVIEMVNIKSSGRSQALTLAAVLTGLVHLLVAILGTFVLKRFPTSFSVGFFLGILVVLANQNLLLMGIFRKQAQNIKSNLFPNIGTCLFVILAFFCMLLYHFKNAVVVAPLSTAASSGAGGGATARNNKAASPTGSNSHASSHVVAEHHHGHSSSKHNKHHHRRDKDDDGNYYHRHGDEEAT